MVIANTTKTPIDDWTTEEAMKLLNALDTYKYKCEDYEHLSALVGTKTVDETKMAVKYFQQTKPPNPIPIKRQKRMRRQQDLISLINESMKQMKERTYHAGALRPTPNALRVLADMEDMIPNHSVLKLIKMYLTFADLLETKQNVYSKKAKYENDKI